MEEEAVDAGAAAAGETQARAGSENADGGDGDDEMGIAARGAPGKASPQRGVAGPSGVVKSPPKKKQPPKKKGGSGGGRGARRH